MKQTSKEAFEAIKPRLQPLHEQIIIAMQGMKKDCTYSYLVETPNGFRTFTVIGRYRGNRYDIAEAARMHHEDCGKRLSELVKLGHLHEVGTNIGRRGRRCTVYVLDAKWIENG